MDPVLPRPRAAAPSPSSLPSPSSSPSSSTAVDGCGCPDGPASRDAGSFSRRSLLKALGIGAMTLVATENVHTQVAFAAPGYTGDVLVVLSLRGGMDGLSAVVPGGDPDYYRLRPSIAVPQSSLLGLDGTFGLHPAMAPLLPLWKAGRLGAVHGVGLPGASRSHFAAMEDMEKAAPGTSLRTGWLDRTLGTRTVNGGAAGTFQAVSLTGSQTPTLLAGPAPELTLKKLEGFELKGPNNDVERARWTKAYTALHAEGPPTVAESGRAALAAAATLSGTLATTSAGSGYPDSDLGASLRDIARMIKAGIGVQVAAVDSGDWDMHAGLGTGGGGWMKDKLAELSTALAAFDTDLGARMSGVTVLTISEFGRRAGENGSGGLDHGHGNLMLALGGGVVGGRVHGKWPGLAASALDDGAVASVTDYRDVIGEVLQKRCGAGSLAEVFPGFSSAGALGLVRAR
ncbi:Uncharacterized conserved protein, DUF1501 family [Quadrisphaera granulorum]|uniref:Uncharacterized protein (DUF1501 family) n=1 Tax=Quadrisphaera granulorum TaxID=317664 RepID=A0A316A7T1_9ACTN|nr:DUF1501 domain-containing protein [Quadrisphaera granulorum]PWJ53030.1 uncharacterized protein (DUF1501 family) [Quadrisphaera granulorum]SZE97195.1 Uncharacterized conserved protein, DUF1501 family [Quadrisphaera granulorum]